MEIFHGKLKTKLNMYAKQHENMDKQRKQSINPHIDVFQ